MVSGPTKAEGGHPLGRVTFAQTLQEIFMAESHLNRRGRETSMAMRNPDFIGCGAVNIVGIKHAPVRGASTPVAHTFLPEGFKSQMPQIATVRGSEFTGSSWDAVVKWFGHYTVEDRFSTAGRGPLLFDAFRFMEASLDVCRAVSSQVDGPQSAAWLMQVLVTHTGWFLEPMGHGSKATFIGRVKAPDRFHQAMKSLLAMNPGISLPGSRRNMVSITPNQYAPLMGVCGHGCGTPYCDTEFLEWTIVRLAVPRDCWIYSHEPRVVTEEEVLDAPLMLRNRIPHGPMMCLFRQASTDGTIAEAAHQPPIVIVQKHFEENKIVPSPRVPCWTCPWSMGASGQTIHDPRGP